MIVVETRCICCTSKRGLGESWTLISETIAVFSFQAKTLHDDRG